MMQGKPSVLDPERQRKLEEMGFVWVVRNRPEWNNRFQELLQYREKYGDTVSWKGVLHKPYWMPKNAQSKPLFHHRRKYHSTTRKSPVLER
jgi:hypothetical protein